MTLEQRHNFDLHPTATNTTSADRRASTNCYQGSTERDEENYSGQEKEDYDNQHQSDCEFPENVSFHLPANTQPSISKITESQFTPIPDDPCKWPESISDAQLCDIVKRGPHQLIMNFPYRLITQLQGDVFPPTIINVCYLMVKVFHGRG